MMNSARSYLGSIGASMSLVAAAVVCIAMVIAVLSFDRIPFGAPGGDADVVTLTQPDGAEGAAAAAAAAIAAAPGAVASEPAPAELSAAAADSSPTSGALPESQVGGIASTSPPIDLPASGPGVDGVTGPGDAANPVDQLTASLDQTVEGTVGVDSDLNGLTKPLTGAVDGVLKDTTGDDLGGHLDGVLGGVGR